MKWKQKVDFTASILFLLTGCFLLLCPLINYTNINILFIVVMITYTIVNFGKFILKKEHHEVESIYSCFASLIVSIVSIFFQINDSTLNLTILLFIWIILESLIKLKKADFYHDRKSKLWLLEMIYLVLFIIMGTFTGINLSQTTQVQILLLGYFFSFYGILELTNPIIIYFTKERRKK